MVTLHDALGYFDLGLAVIPIRPGTKKAACGWKQFQHERPTESHLRKWFGGDDQRALAVIMGEVSGGLVCRDFDQMTSYERWAADHLELAQRLPTVETARPWRHVYALANADQIRLASKTESRIIVLGDGELRGGGYCLVPPSVHPDGPSYRWLVPLPNGLRTVDLVAVGWLGCNRENGDYRGYQSEQKTLSSANSCPLSSQGTLSSLLHERIELAIARCLPTSEGQRNRMLFELSRELKALPELADAAIIALKPYLQQWHQAALPTIKTKPLEESWFEFARSWPKVKFPKGQEPIAMIFAKAVATPVPEVAEQYETPSLRLLVSWCRELQRASGDSPFFLSSRTAGDHLGIDHTTAWRWLRGLQTDEILGLVESGTHAQHRANRYRYLAPI